MSSGKPAPWQRPGHPLDVTCWCERKVRPQPVDAIADGTAGWACSHPQCIRLAPVEVTR
ncbi:MAG: hypothetical protein H6983_26630 [Ectothiorhodospiraceae bacterium]|nr:hypothetical protein [Ectothiorhodospiraceae bacterium]MCP5157777.1 hypothetical protein [Ectothiorhodospiraceae bacterium]